MNPNERTTGRMPEMLQDCDRRLSRALSNTPDARMHAREAAAAAGVTLPLPPSIPEGFRLLPVEATDSMMDADWDVSMSDAHSNGGVSAAAWRAMVEAAPQVTYGNGHSGVGWYMHDTEYPEEGAVFLSEPARGVAPSEARESSIQRDTREIAETFARAPLFGVALPLKGNDRD